MKARIEFNFRGFERHILAEIDSVNDVEGGMWVYQPELGIFEPAKEKEQLHYYIPLSQITLIENLGDE